MKKQYKVTIDDSHLFPLVKQLVMMPMKRFADDLGPRINILNNAFDNADDVDYITDSIDRIIATMNECVDLLESQKEMIRNLDSSDSDA